MQTDSREPVGMVCVRILPKRASRSKSIKSKGGPPSAPISVGSWQYGEPGLGLWVT